MAKDFITGLDIRIRAEMAEKQLSVKELCSRTGIGKTSMYSILNTSSITAAEAIKLADALGVTTDYLLRGVTASDPTPYVPQNICTHFKCIDPEQSNSKRCCFYCPNKESCSNPCLNDPALCGLFI